MFELEVHNCRQRRDLTICHSEMREAAATRVAAALMASEGDARVSDAMEEDARSGDPGTRVEDARGERGAFTTPSRDPSAVGPARSPAHRLSTPRQRPVKTTRVCALCPTAKGDGPAGLLAHVDPAVDRGGVAPPRWAISRALSSPDKNGIKHTWAHQNCILWCPEVYFDARLERLKHVEEAIKRGKQLKCAHCGRKGAAVGCTLRVRANVPPRVRARRVSLQRRALRRDVPHAQEPKRTPAPVWSKTMHGDEALAEARPETAGDAAASGARGAPPRAPKPRGTRWRFATAATTAARVPGIRERKRCWSASPLVLGRRPTRPGVRRRKETTERRRRTRRRSGSTRRGVCPRSSAREA